MEGWFLLWYGKKIFRSNKRYYRKHGTINGSGLGTGLLAGLFSFLV